ncbi:MAG TPA: DUF2254 domain-containing protein [Gaiellaceae bacterium]|nr:DUF2254 domain-containing protein [Gaiellaceae bacterium]
MGLNLRARWLNLLHTLWFLPTLIGAGYVALALGLLRVDATVNPHAIVFSGSAQAARTVLQTIADALITTAGLTFSVTMVVLQLASTQFSPRVLRNFLGDRIAQITIGAFVGIFAYCLVALRSIGASGAAHVPVPRLTVTVASVLALLALVLLVVFIHHFARLIQASELTAGLGGETLRAIDKLYPSGFGAAEEEDPAEIVARWRGAGARGTVAAGRAGFVQSIDLGVLETRLPEPRPRVHVLVAPGDFVGKGEPIVEVWPEDAADALHAAADHAVATAGERDIDQDAHFGIRQLVDIALKAISPAMNDPTTAATCIGYLRSALVVLAAREIPSAVRRPEDGGEPIIVRRREFGEYLDTIAEIGRYANGDARVVRDLLAALERVAGAALAAGAEKRAVDVLAVAEAVGEQALAEARSSRDRALVEAALEQVEGALTPVRP